MLLQIHCHQVRPGTCPGRATKIHLLLLEGRSDSCHRFAPHEAPLSIGSRRSHHEALHASIGNQSQKSARPCPVVNSFVIGTNRRLNLFICVTKIEPCSSSLSLRATRFSIRARTFVQKLRQNMPTLIVGGALTGKLSHSAAIPSLKSSSQTLFDVCPFFQGRRIQNRQH